MEGNLVGRDDHIRSLISVIDAGRGALLVGDVGVGKSHLALAAARYLSQRDGTSIELIAGSTPGRSVAFGAVAHLLDGAEAASEPALMQAVTERLRQLGQDGNVVVVDDVDLLDDASRSVIHRLSHDIPLIATVRSDTAVDPFVVGLWKDGRLARIEVGPIDRASSCEMIDTMLGGSSSQPLHDEIWHRAHGNPLLIRELCAAGRSSGAIERRSERWTLVEALDPDPRIIDLVGARITQLDDDELTILMAIALADPFPVTVIEAMGVGAVVVRLERGRLVQQLHTDGRAVVRPSHPIVAEAVRAMANAVRLDDVAERLSDVVARTELDSSDLRRLTLIVVRSGRRPGPALALRAAGAALVVFDAAAAEELARIAVDDGSELGAEHEIAARLALGRALAGRGEFDEAILEFERVAGIAEHPEEHTAAVLGLSEMLMFGARRPHDAIARLRSALGDPDPLDATAAPRLHLQLALAYGIVEDLGRASELTAGLLAQPQLEPDIEVQASMIRTLTAAMSGRVDDIDDELDRGERLATMLQDTHPLARDQIGLNRVLTLHTRAEFDASRHLVESVRGAADFSARLMGPWYYIDGLADLLRGDVDRAIEHTTSSIRLLRERDDVGTRPMALALGGLAYAMRDDELRAQELIDESLADGGERQIRSRLWIDVAGAWIAAQRGDLLEGARRAVAAGRDAIVSGHTVWGAVAVHTAVRFGHADLAAPALADLDAGPLASLLADHANADDAVALAKVADDLVDHAMLGLAAEVWATIARHETADDLVRAPAALRASALTDRSPGLHSPLVESLPSPLTPRQHQIAVLAARGRPTGAIADELFVSTKTVDNHLQNIYRVLGIGSRSELAQILDD